MAGEQASRCNERKTDYQQSAQNGFVHRRVQQRKFSFMAYHHREKVFLLNHFRIFCFPRRQSRRIDSSRCLPKIHPFGQKNDRVGDEKKPIFVPCACNSSIVPTPPCRTFYATRLSRKPQCLHHFRLQCTSFHTATQTDMQKLPESRLETSFSLFEFFGDS